MIDMKKLRESEKADSPIEKEWECCGFKCVVMFLRKSWRNGYIRIPKRHPAFEIKNYDDIPMSVHGGLTYGSKELMGFKDDDNFFWYGFDTAHCGDRSTFDSIDKGHLWTTDEIAKECENMAKQFKELTWKKIIEKKLEYEPEWFKKRVTLKKVK